MRWSINQVTPPAVEPVSLAELKQNIHITYDLQDDTLTSFIVAARLQAEEYQRRAYITQRWELTLDKTTRDTIYLLRNPVQEVLSIIVHHLDGTETTMDLTDFDIDVSAEPARVKIKRGASWPAEELRGLGAVKIRYEAGYGDAATDVPANIRHAIRLFASFAEDNRAADETQYPQAFWDLLRPNRIHTYEPW